MYVGEVGVGHGFRILSVSVAFVKAASLSSQPCGLLLLPYRQAVAHGQPLFFVFDYSIVVCITKS